MNKVITLGTCIASLPSKVKSSVRLLERTEKKLINCKCSLLFNQTCIQENLLPKYTKFKLYNSAIENDASTVKYRRGLVEKEIKSASARLTELEKLVSTLKDEIAGYQCDLGATLDCLHDVLSNYNSVSRVKIVKKLSQLYHAYHIIPNDKHICIKNHVQCFVNLSDYQLSQTEENFLNLGLNCHTMPKYSKILK